MSDPVLGVVFRRNSIEPMPTMRADMSTICLVGPMPDADSKVFPVNRGIVFNSNDTRFTKKLGVQGFIPDAIEGINLQLARAQFAARVCVIRTQHSTAADPAVNLRETMMNIVGSSLSNTGIWAALLVPEDQNAVPRLWSVPGYTGASVNTVGALNITTAGAGYVPGKVYTLTFSGGGSGAIQATGHAVGDDDGSLGETVIDTYGMFYTAAPTVTVPDPDDPSVTAGNRVKAVITATYDRLANPICASLPGPLNELLAHAFVESSGTSQINDTNWREGFSSDRLIPLSGGVKITSTLTGEVVVRPLSPRAVGIQVRRDHETGAPFHSACNQPIYGVVGPGRRIPFNISALENEGQQLLNDNIGIVVAGETGNDFAIADGGYVLLTTDNAGDEDLWRFYNQVRGRDYIHLLMQRLQRYYIGKFNVTFHTIQAVVNGMENILRNLQANECIIGFKVQFLANDNSADALRAGRITVSFAAEEPAPLRLIINNSSRYRPAIDAMVSQLEQQLSFAA